MSLYKHGLTDITAHKSMEVDGGSHDTLDILAPLNSCAYCKFGNFREGFIFQETSHMVNFVKIMPWKNGEITLSFTAVGKSVIWLVVCFSRDILPPQICLCLQYIF